MVTLLWVGFIVLVLFLLALDLGVLNRKAHVIGTKEALGWTAFWIFLALLFNVAIYFLYEHHILGIGEKVGDDMPGGKAAMLFFTGYIVEKSLSLDNIFVIALIFSYFRVPAIYQHRVLFWGVLGALIMRGVMIAIGAALIERFQWILYIFGAFLIITAIKMLLAGDEEPHVEKNPVVRIARRLLPVSKDYDGQKFFTRIAPGEEAAVEASPVPPQGSTGEAPKQAPVLPPGAGRWAVTPMFLVLLVIEFTDVVFAVDSIPAIFGITTDAFIVFTSNVFAILGLRSLYFALAALLDKFRYLKISLVFVLVFIGAKMILEQWFGGGHTEDGQPHHLIPTEVSLGIILLTLLVGVAASMLKSRSDRSEAPREEIP